MPTKDRFQLNTEFVWGLEKYALDAIHKDNRGNAYDVFIFREVATNEVTAMRRHQAVDRMVTVPDPVWEEGHEYAGVSSAHSSWRKIYHVVKVFNDGDALVWYVLSNGSRDSHIVPAEHRDSYDDVTGKQ